jgi:hypothetical protein
MVLVKVGGERSDTCAERYVNPEKLLYDAFFLRNSNKQKSGGNVLQFILGIYHFRSGLYRSI